MVWTKLELAQFLKTAQRVSFENPGAKFFASFFTIFWGGAKLRVGQIPEFYGICFSKQLTPLHFLWRCHYYYFSYISMLYEM